MQEDIILFVISGSAGSGKTSMIKNVINLYGTDLISSFPSSTTRPMRAGEVNGVDYIFVNKDEFNQAIKTHEIVEAKRVYQNFYGTNIKSILATAEHSKCLIKDFDVEGYKNVVKRIKYSLIKDNLPLFPIVTILVDAQDEVLVERMLKRNDNTNVEERKQALSQDRISKNSNHYDYIIDTTNLSIDEATSSLVSIINTEYSKNFGKPVLVKRDLEQEKL